MTRRALLLVLAGCAIWVAGCATARPVPARHAPAEPASAGYAPPRVAVYCIFDDRGGFAIEAIADRVGYTKLSLFEQPCLGPFETREAGEAAADELSSLRALEQDPEEPPWGLHVRQIDLDDAGPLEEDWSLFLDAPRLIALGYGAFVRDASDERDVATVLHTNSFHHVAEPGALWILDGPSGCAHHVRNVWSSVIVPGGGGKIVYSYADSMDDRVLQEPDLREEIAANIGTTVPELMASVYRDENALEYEQQIVVWRIELDVFNPAARTRTLLHGLGGGGSLWREGDEIAGTPLPLAFADTMTSPTQRQARRLVLGASPRWEPRQGTQPEEEERQAIEGTDWETGAKVHETRDGRLRIVAAFANGDEVLLQPAVRGATTTAIRAARGPRCPEPELLFTGD